MINEISFYERPIMFRAVKYDGKNLSELERLLEESLETDAFFDVEWGVTSLHRTHFLPVTVDIGDYVLLDVECEIQVLRGEVFRYMYREYGCYKRLERKAEGDCHDD